MMFFTVPKYIMLNIIQEFCSIVDVCKLETAMGSPKEIRVLQDHFCSSSVSVGVCQTNHLPLSMVWWASKRKIFLKELTVLMTFQKWKKVYDHQRTDYYASLTRATALCADFTGLQLDFKSWLTRIYQYFIGTSNKLILCSSLVLLIQSERLTSLELIGVPYAIDDTLVAIAEKLHGLKVLRLEDFHKLSVRAVAALVKNNADLQKVSLWNNAPLWARVVIESVLTEHLPPRLEELSLTFTAYEAYHASASLTTLFHHCGPHLTALTTNTWDALINAHLFPSLTRLTIAYTMDNYVLYYSVPSWRHPTFLLHVCIDVSATTDITAYYIVKSHPQLLSLYLVGSDFVTVVAVQDTLKYCRQIQSLGFVRCSLLGCDSVYNIANKRPPSLTALSLRGLQGISTECVLHLLCLNNSMLACKVLY